MVIKKLLPAIVFIIFSVILYVETFNFPVSRGNDIGSAFWPRLQIYLLVGLSLLYIISVYRNRDKPEGEGEETAEEDASYKKPSKAVYGIIIFIGFAFLFEILGYIISILLLYFALAYVMYGDQFKHRLKNVVLQAVVILAVVYVIFPVVLNVRLPNGIFF